MPSHLRQTLDISTYFFLLNGNRQPGFEPVYFSGEAVSEMEDLYWALLNSPEFGWNH